MNPIARLILPALLACGTGLAFAQTANTPATTAQQIYESDIALCNGANTPAPAREACVRAAGDRLDRARGGPPSETAVTSPDGRATVMSPQGATPPPTSSDAVLSRDGRANVVPNR